jgi:hypothetical protein
VVEHLEQGLTMITELPVVEVAEPPTVLAEAIETISQMVEMERQIHSLDWK